MHANYLIKTNNWKQWRTLQIEKWGTMSVKKWRQVVLAKLFFCLFSLHYAPKGLHSISLYSYNDNKVIHSFIHSICDELLKNNFQIWHQIGNVL